MCSLSHLFSKMGRYSSILRFWLLLLFTKASCSQNMIPWRTLSIAWEKFLNPTPRPSGSEISGGANQPVGRCFQSSIFLSNKPVLSSAPVTTPKILQIHKKKKKKTNNFFGILVVSALRRQRQRDLYKFKVSLISPGLQRKTLSDKRMNE